MENLMCCCVIYYYSEGIIKTHVRDQGGELGFYTKRLSTFPGCTSHQVSWYDFILIQGWSKSDSIQFRDQWSIWDNTVWFNRTTQKLTTTKSSFGILISELNQMTKMKIQYIHLVRKIILTIKCSILIYWETLSSCLFTLKQDFRVNLFFLLKVSK